MANKFFNTNLNNDNNSSENNNVNNEYSDKIYVSPSKAKDEYIDVNNKIPRFFLIGLGSFCIIGVIYYIIQWLSSK